MRQQPVMRSDGMGAVSGIACRSASAEMSSSGFFASITFSQISGWQIAPL